MILDRISWFWLTEIASSRALSCQSGWRANRSIAHDRKTLVVSLPAKKNVLHSSINCCVVYFTVLLSSVESLSISRSIRPRRSFPYDPEARRSWIMFSKLLSSLLIRFHISKFVGVGMYLCKRTLSSEFNTVQYKAFNLYTNHLLCRLDQKFTSGMDDYMELIHLLCNLPFEKEDIIVRIIFLFGKEYLPLLVKTTSTIATSIWKHERNLAGLQPQDLSVVLTQYIRE